MKDFAELLAAEGQEEFKKGERCRRYSSSS